MVTAIGPGRVNLIGEHTDTTGGLVLPLAIGLATTVSGERGGNVVHLTSAELAEPAVVPLDVTDPATMAPGWARYVAGVVAELRPAHGFRGTVSTTLPIGAGLSSSAALEVAVALALGFEGSTLELARLTQRAEVRASGVPCGIMDQLASAAGVAGHALLIDCHSLEVTPVALPPAVEVRVVHSGQERELAGSAYAERRAAVEAAEAVLGPLRLVTDPEDVDRLDDAVLRRRARHVVTENARPGLRGRAGCRRPGGGRRGHGRQPRLPARRLRGVDPGARRVGRPAGRHARRPRRAAHGCRLRRVRRGAHRARRTRRGMAGHRRRRRPRRGLTVRRLHLAG
ncbi:hypothetical protein KSP35_06875 [Aquihabitans sp. G128]|nr:galactokinase family protein [Aquihabitans sp. G128]QXC62518.1 hypothetical protein KSP35_06875 [Aquihabitans sp. G128]